MTTLNGNSLFSNAITGLNTTFVALMKGSQSGGLTLEQITNPNAELVNSNTINASFAQYLSSNFSSIDTDADGQITSNDLSKLMENIAKKGLTYDEIVQLGSSGAISATMLDQVLNYFNEIDKNKDGRITSEEITAYSMESDRFELEQKYGAFDASTMSVFYGDENSSFDATSVLAYKYPTKNS